ncbi:BppU family phage baseplate upper protein, partial [Enterococcus hermanniensis]|uniref:BppU family phage baseplate upper protein n=1 Tax=Enterococcus hermanniensis TaxID=249189 RepID=UPI00090038D8
VMFKTKEEIIIIQAEAKEPIATRAVFWSHDKGTAKMLFKLRKDGTSQSLAEGTIVPVLLKFNSETAEDGIGRHIYHAVIEDAVNGIVSIVLENNILGYQGRVEGSIYIELPDSRSLDTAGRFTFHIKRSPIDEDVPELEDYYWQGFSEIMEQYHESIAEIKLEAKALLDSLTADVTTAKTKVTQLEQSITTANTNLNARIDEISKKIDDNDVFTKAESSANVIDQITGAESAELSATCDFVGKIADSVVENPNFAHYGITNGKPTTLVVGNKEATTNYAKLASVDGDLRDGINQGVNGVRYERLSYNILHYAKKMLGEQFFVERGANDIASQVEVLKTLDIKGINRVWGFGSSAGGNKLITKIYSSTGWTNEVSSTSNAVDELSQNITNDDMKTLIQSDGFIYVFIYTEPSDGITGSRLVLDCGMFDLKIKVSANDYIKSMIAQNHVTNLATADEAKAGTNTTKTMAPATTAQLIDYRAVTLASNQTIGGIKNFKDGLMVADTSVVVDRYIEKTVVTTNTTDFTAESTVIFQRWGRM